LNASLAAVGNVYGAGLYRSNDGGTTWTLINITDTLTQGFSDIILSPTDANKIVAGTSTGIRLSTNGGSSFTVSRREA